MEGPRFRETFWRFKRYVGEMRTTMLGETHERKLVEKARGGDPGALEEIFADLRERLLATIRSRLSPAVRHRVDPEDVLQDTFIRALHSVGRFQWQGEDSFRRWLEAIATHVALDVARHQGRRRELHIDRDIEGADVTPSKGMRRKERFKRLVRSIETLSQDYQMVLRLSRIEGLSVKEIAGRMDRSESAVKNLLLRATKQLRQAFGDTESYSLDGRHLYQDEGGDDRDAR